MTLLFKTLHKKLLLDFDLNLKTSFNLKGHSFFRVVCIVETYRNPCISYLSVTVADVARKAYTLG